MTGAALVLQANALQLPLPDESVDLVVTSPPYAFLRAYDTGYPDLEVGNEPTPAAYLEALWAATAEMARVLKPTGSMFVDLGDCYARDGGVGKSRSLDGAGKGSEGQRMRTRLSSAELTREQASWLAGMIDSDGSISIHVNKQPEGRAPSFVPWVRIGQMMPQAVQHAGKITGIGQVYQDARGCWNWSASSQQARWVLERIYPWLLIKQRQAAGAIEVARHVEERNGRGSYRPLTTNDVAYRQRLQDAVRAWNRGEHDPLEPPEPRTVPLPIYPCPPREKSLNLLPEQYRLGCIGYLGLIARQVVIWDKPNSLPESVVDRPRRSHEDWVMLTKQPRYYSAIDEVRESYSDRVQQRQTYAGRDIPSSAPYADANRNDGDRAKGILGFGHNGTNPLGKLPGSVWSIPSEPLRLPDWLGVDHYAAFPSEWPRRLILGFSPHGICLDCGQGRVPVVDKRQEVTQQSRTSTYKAPENGRSEYFNDRTRSEATILGYACSCTPYTDHAGEGGTGGGGDPLTAYGNKAHWGKPTANLGDRPRSGPWREYHLDGWKPPPTRPAVVLDPFSGVGTTIGVARQLGRIGIGIDLSHSYCRAAKWRVFDADQFTKAQARTWAERQGSIL